MSGLLVRVNQSIAMVPVADIREMYKALECTCFDRRGTRYPVGIYFDDEFMLKFGHSEEAQQANVNQIGTLLAAMLTGPEFPLIYGNMLFVQEAGEDVVDMERDIRRGLVGAIHYIGMTIDYGKEM